MLRKLSRLNQETDSARACRRTKTRISSCLDQNQCLEITIVARDIELTLSVTKPDGNQLMKFNAPSAEGAPQPIPIIAEMSGNYILSVSCRSKMLPPDAMK